MAARTRISFASCNLYNINLPGLRIYTDSKGWDEAAYVIETLDEDGAKMTEAYALSEDREALVRSILIMHGDDQQLSLEQIFDRI